ncbi:MAG: AmmeMemoRadiSam system protein A [Spirochaetales bacterium]|nr:AmmeMemoRadiSam system protein A [Spirochaetales bacterium]
MAFTLTDDEKKILLETARLSIASRLKRTSLSLPEAPAHLQEKCGAFVSLHIGEYLRGCIGYITAVKPLIETIKEMAECAAFSDPRFPPLAHEELEKVEIEISVLSPFEKITDLSTIKVGTHGIMVRKGLQSGLLLPQVAVEYDWDREQFLSHTCQKAGLPSSAWRSGNLEVEIFSAVVFSERQFGQKSRSRSEER